MKDARPARPLHLPLDFGDRRAFRATLRETIAETVERDDEVDDEVRYLLGVIGRRA